MMTADTVGGVAVLGAGTMGAGIAQVAAAAGHATWLQDMTIDLASAGKARLAKGLEGQVAKGKMAASDAEAIVARITPVGGVEDAVREADLVIEAVPENLELKSDLFRRVCAATRETTIVATNTSSLSLAKLSESVSNPGRFIGLHFFNPPPVMKLLEIVRASTTSDATLDACRALALRWGKDPIVVRDSPGFASSRLGIALGMEAIRMVEEGVASAADIDKAMELGYRHPMGPLKLTDLVGLDVRLDIARYLAKELDDRRFAPPKLLEQKVREGHVGKKSGRGFYTWVGGEPTSADGEPKPE